MGSSQPLRLPCLQGNVTLDQVPTSDGELQSWQNEARRRMSNNFGGAIEGGKTNATADMFEYAVADSLKAVENEPQGIAHLKHEVRRTRLQPVVM